MDTQSKVNWLKLLLSSVLIAVLLYFGRNLFVPLSFALLISFILYPVCKWLEQKKLPRWAAIAFCLLLLLIVIGLLVWLLVRQMVSFAKEWPGVEAKLIDTWDKLSTHVEHTYNIDTDRQKVWLESMASDIASSAFGMAQGVLYTSAVSLVLLLLIPIYIALILYYREQLAKGLYLLFRKDEQKKIRLILQETITTYYNFIKGMAIVYLVVAVLNSVGLLLLGIPHAVFFGIVASVLTFIPYVGITIGAILPMAIAWVTYDNIWYPIGVIIVFGVVQYLEANLIFPWAVSYRLRVNMLFTLLAIVAGGILWGASGMILFIPFLAILKLIADKHEAMRAVSVLLGNGND
ncbi:putative PurR-regulated permease PerM [Pontibacter aydingkolensis]|uniref:AI-2E family transporter n=1 Tax=Pontibacter aydingkolensis TaxID=1911536 RepID=A0ABS7CUZ5_9BACT|nr:AI-2E family transporter [Pontibacter aydingkolensis]MBW7467615.1 AI-2E family transporter [Pontibacter aydingkolensis]